MKFNKIFKYYKVYTYCTIYNKIHFIERSNYTFIITLALQHKISKRKTRFKYLYNKIIHKDNKI